MTTDEDMTVEHNARIDRKVLAAADLIEAMVGAEPPRQARTMDEAMQALAQLLDVDPMCASQLEFWALGFIGIPLH
jgi:hypothetical protein